MARTVILTALYGRYDTLRAQAAQDIDVDWLCITDDPDLQPPEPWRVRVQPPRHPHPCMAAKWHKTTPAATGYDHVVWIDANMEVTSPAFARDALAQIRDGMALHRHPRRDCIYQEAEASIGSEGQDGKYANLPIREQAAAYRAEGHPHHGGLYACGTIAWDATDPLATTIGSAWYAECERFGYQDQISLPVVCRRLGMTPGVFSHPQLERRFRTRDYLANRWLRIHPHL